MKNNAILIVFIFFIFGIFLYNDYFNIAGKVPEGRYCYDNDGGVMIYTAGKVSSDIGTFYDKCYDNLKQIREYYCGKGRYGGAYKVESKVRNCGIGYVCIRDILLDADACMQK